MYLFTIRTNMLVIFLFGVFPLSNSELFTSSLKLCHLLKMELEQLAFFERNLKEQTESKELYDMIQEIRNEVPKYYFNQAEYDVDECLDENSKISRFVTNPVNAYMLIYRFIATWSEVQRLARYHVNSIISNYSDYYPLSYTELRGARDAFYRLQMFYMLDTKYLKDGTLSPEWEQVSKAWTIVPKSLTPNDIFEIGKIAFTFKDYESAKSWMITAYQDLIKERSDKDRELLFDILDYLSWSEYQTGDSESAFDHCEEMVTIHPKNTRVNANLKVFNESRFETPKNTNNRVMDFVIKSLEDKESLQNIKRVFSNKTLREIYESYENSMSQLICKIGQLWEIDEENLAGTGCYVQKGTNEFGKFVTANVEKIFSNHDTYILRSMVNERDIIHFKKLARQHLRTATVHNPITGILETANYRITQSSWFNIDSDPFIRKMKTKLKVATGLSLTSSEDLQLANYGIGGYYDSHFDFAKRDEPSINDTLNRRNGGRLATYLLYMSDVTIGGKTAFPRVGISVQPSKGDALFWYNLLPDESGDARTRHIACPVALGTKWVGNFWIRSKGEERSRPCDLQEQNGI